MINIIFKPSKFITLQCLKFHFNIDILSLIFSNLINLKFCFKTTRTFVIHVKLCKNNKIFGQYNFNNKSISISTLAIKNKYIFIETLIHEFIHWMQHNLLKIKSDEIVGGDYDTNLFEKKCNDFEKINKDLILLHNKYNKILKLLLKI